MINYNERQRYKEKGFYRCIDTVLALLQTMPTEDYISAEKYRKTLHTEIREIQYSD